MICLLLDVVSCAHRGCRFVFVGDSGQGDVRLAEMMLKSSSHVKLVLIHDVVSKQNVYKTPADKYPITSSFAHVSGTDVLNLQASTAEVLCHPCVR